MHNGHVSVKEAVLPFARFAGADSVLGPEMKSHRRGDGDRGGLPDRVRQGPGGRRRLAARPRAPSSSPSPTPTRRPRPSSRRASTTSASRSSPPRGTAQAISRMGIPVTAINKIGEGSPHVVDFIRSARGRHGDQHARPAAARARTATRSAAPRSASGIPCITTMTGASAAARAIFAARERRRRAASACRSCTSRRGVGASSRAERADGARPRAVRAARAARSSRNEATGGYRIVSALDAERPDARARGSSTCSPRTSWGGAGGPPVPAARLLGRRGRGRRPTACGSTSCSRRSAPAPSGSRRSRRARRCTSPGPLGRPFSAPPSSSPAPPGRSWSAAGSGSRRWRSCAASSPTAASRSGSCSGFRDRDHSGGLGALPLLGGAARQRGRPHRPPGLRHRPARGAARGRRRRRRPPSTPAGRRRCSRRCASCAPSAGSPPSWRWRRRWRAASAPASAAPCRSPAAATCACAWTGRWSRGDEIETALVAGSGH